LTKLKRLIVAVFLVMFGVPSVLAEWNWPWVQSWQSVKLMLAYDEEFDYASHFWYQYNPEVLIDFLMTKVQIEFKAFYIKLCLSYYRSWDSDDSVHKPNEMLKEAIREVGFVSGAMADMLVAFTDQDILNAYGQANSTLGAVIVQLSDLSGVGQATDNVVQHELGHLYLCPDHWMPNHNCIMNGYPYWIDFPWNYYVPTFVVTHNWCSECRQTITGNASRWGITRVYGAKRVLGGSGRFPI